MSEFYGRGVIGELIDLQRKVNAGLSEMTPQQRAEFGRAALLDMARAEPELRYLFPDVDFDDA